MVNALQHEHEYLFHDDFDPVTDVSIEEHHEWLNKLTVEQLVTEMSAKKELALEVFMDKHCDS